MKINIPEHIEAMKVIIKAVEYKSLIRTDYKELTIHLSIDNTLIDIRKIIPTINVEMALSWFLTHPELFASSIGIGNISNLKTLNHSFILEVQEIPETEKEELLKIEQIDTGILIVIDIESHLSKEAVVLEYLKSESDDIIPHQKRLVRIYPGTNKNLSVIKQESHIGNINMKIMYGLKESTSIRIMSSQEDALDIVAEYNAKIQEDFKAKIKEIKSLIEEI